MSWFPNSTFFTKEKSESLKKIRIIKPNLIHAHGFPKSLAKNSILKSPEYFGQYGTILNSIISEKTNPENNNKIYSAYITYSNKIEASLAILCVDSLMIKGKIIHVFFGTTKYCDYFLNNVRCPNFDKCPFLHQCASDKDIIIKSFKEFSYNEHLNLAKKIIQISNPKTMYLLQTKKKPEKNIFPNIDFIYMTEEEKEIYLSKGNLAYAKGKNKDISNNNKLNSEDGVSKNDFASKEVSNKLLKNSVDNNINNLNDNIALHKVFETSFKCILLFKPFFNKIDNKSIKKMEFVFMKNDLKKKGFDVDKLLDGCLDNMKYI